MEKLPDERDGKITKLEETKKKEKKEEKNAISEEMDKTSNSKQIEKIVECFFYYRVH